MDLFLYILLGSLLCIPFYLLFREIYLFFKPGQVVSHAIETLEREMTPEMTRERVSIETYLAESEAKLQNVIYSINFEDDNGIPELYNLTAEEADKAHSARIKTDIMNAVQGLESFTYELNGNGLLYLTSGQTKKHICIHGIDEHRVIRLLDKLSEQR